MDEITVIIKTMIRPKSLQRLIRSFQKFYPDIKILIADDGNPSSKDFILSKFPAMNISYYQLPSDSGLSYGRNFLLNKVTTKYFLLCDDDFVIDHTLQLDEMIRMLEEKKLDILGGYFRNYKIVSTAKDRLIVLAQKILHYELDTNYIGNIERNGKELTVRYVIKQFPAFTYTDLCHNFFIAKTEQIKAMQGWDNDLKLQEHTEFFIRAKGYGIKVGFTNKMSVKHFPERGKNYSTKRNRDFSIIYLRKHKIQKATYFYDEKGRDYEEYFDEDGVYQTRRLGGDGHE